jgi:geranylgeranyl transferase type-2 subunit beta
MLQVARLAPRQLGDASDLIVSFLHSQINADGGFKDRVGASDLYYTVFGLEGLLALQADVPAPAVAVYLREFGDGDSLDFVHLTCLARCWACLPASLRGEAPREAILRRIETFRSEDGGYDAEPGSEHGTVYGCFLALGAYQDLQAEMPDSHRMLGCLHHLRAADGGYANQDDMPMGLTPATAAAITLLRHLHQPPQPELGRWLLARCRQDGGFFATPLAPIPDLLSTATALHALAGLQMDVGHLKEPCLDFIDSLWTNRGAFYGTWADDVPDCEYTYYGLLALGHLSL